MNQKNEAIYIYTYIRAIDSIRYWFQSISLEFDATTSNTYACYRGYL